MGKSIITKEVDGFLYEIHNVAIDNGKTPIGVVEVFAPKSLEDLANGIKAGIETEREALTLYTAQKTIVMQGQARAMKKGGKMPRDVQARIFNTLTNDELMQGWSAVEALINQKYRDELESA